MALFGKKKPSIDTVPQEVRDYYQSERRERTGFAWLLALGTLVVTLMLALGLWFGGKWVYQTLTNRDDTASTGSSTQLTQKTDDKKSEGKVSDKPAVTNQPSSSNGTSNTTPATSGSTATTPAASTPGGSASNQTSTPASSGGTVASSNTTQSSETASRLANTGPTETLYVFAIAFIGGYVGYRLWLRHIA